MLTFSVNSNCRSFRSELSWLGLPPYRCIYITQDVPWKSCIFQQKSLNETLTLDSLNLKGQRSERSLKLVQLRNKIKFTCVAFFAKLFSFVILMKHAITDDFCPFNGGWGESFKNLEYLYGITSSRSWQSYFWCQKSLHINRTWPWKSCMNPKGKKK